ncbi:MAG: ECF-type sigma factor [Planctomycetota bacterium]|nr:ECF-type sigma factor [Planctomycetota bacterium]
MPPSPSTHEGPDHGPPSGGNPGSDHLLALVYEQLREVARHRLSAENPGHTLQATALVHEAFLRIGQDRRVPFRDRAHFFAVAAEAMRRILIDHARAKGAAKRRPPAAEFLSVVDLAEHRDPEQIMALDAALQRLEGAEPEVAAVVRLRFFAGLSGNETAEALGISPRQVDRLWAYARAWLAREISPSE